MSHVPPGKEIDLGGKYGVKSCEDLRQAFAAYVKTSVEDGDLKDIVANYVKAPRSCFLVAERVDDDGTGRAASSDNTSTDRESKSSGSNDDVNTSRRRMPSQIVGCVALQPKSVSGMFNFSFAIYTTSSVPAQRVSLSAPFPASFNPPTLQVTGTPRFSTNASHGEEKSKRLKKLHQSCKTLGPSIPLPRWFASPTTTRSASSGACRCWPRNAALVSLRCLFLRC